MSEHYFTSQPRAEHKPLCFKATLRDREYTFHTDAGVFSKDEIDLGSKILIESLPANLGETVLDLGCGYGPVGMVAASLVNDHGRVYLVDVNERAVDLANKNIKANKISNAQASVSDGLQNLAGYKFDNIITNPPIRAGKKVIYPMLADAYDALKPGGCLFVVIRTKQGAKSLESHLQGLSGDCSTIQKKSGFRVLKCCKPPST